MNDINPAFEKNDLIEAAKEALRIMVLAVVPIMITGIQNSELSWQLIGVTALIAALKFVDKLLHEIGKREGNRKKILGLTQF